MNQDLEQFIPQPKRRSTQPLSHVVSPVDSPKVWQTKDSNSATSNNFMRVTAINLKSIKEEDILSGAIKKSSVLSDKRDVQPAVEGTGTNTNSLSHKSQGSLTIVQVQELESPIISSRKKVMVMGKDSTNRKFIKLRASPSDQDSYSPKMNRTLQQQPSLHMNSGTITQNSQVYQQLLRMPMNNRNNPEGETVNPQIQLPEYQSLPSTQQGFRRDINDNSSLKDRSPRQNLRVEVEFNRSSLFESQTESPIVRLNQQEKEQKNAQNNHQHQQFIQTKLRNISKANSITQSRESLEKVGMNTTTSFSPSKVKTIHFQRGANGPQTKATGHKNNNSPKSSRKIIEPILRQMGRDQQPSFLPLRTMNQTTKQNKDHNNYAKRRLQNSLSPSMKSFNNAKDRYSKVGSKPTLRGQQNGGIYNNQAITFTGTGSMILDQDQLPYPTTLQNSQLGPPPFIQEQNGALNSQLAKQFNEIYVRLNQQVIQMKTDQSGSKIYNSNTGMETGKISEVQSQAEKSPLSPPYRKSSQNSAKKFNIWPNSMIDQAVPTSKERPIIRIPQAQVSPKSSSQTLHQELRHSALSNKQQQHNQQVTIKSSTMQSLNFGQIMQNEERMKYNDKRCDHNGDVGLLKTQQIFIDTRTLEAQVNEERPISHQSIQQQKSTMTVNTQFDKDDQRQQQQKQQKANIKIVLQESTKFMGKEKEFEKEQSPMVSSLKSPNTAFLSQTMSPMNINNLMKNTSNQTLEIISPDEYSHHKMARTYMTNTERNTQEKDRAKQDVMVEDGRCNCSGDVRVVDNQTLLNGYSEEQYGSELKGWEQQQPRNINITLQSVLGNSHYDGHTIYNSTASQYYKKGFQSGQGVIKIDHSPSLSMIYTRSPHDQMYQHKKTQQRAIEARTISLNTVVPEMSNESMALTRKNFPFTSKNAEVNYHTSTNVGEYLEKASSIDKLMGQTSSRAIYQSFDGTLPSQAIRGRNKISSVMQSQDVTSKQNLLQMEQTAYGNKSPFMNLTKDQERQIKLKQKRSLMQLPNLPSKALHSQSQAEHYEDPNALNPQNMMSTIRMVNQGHALGHQSLSLPQHKAQSMKPNGGKFIAISSIVRQKQLIKVQKDKSQARLQQHMQRFERLFEKNGTKSTNYNNSYSIKPTMRLKEDFGIKTANYDHNNVNAHNNRLNTILKHSPRPIGTNFLQSPTPTLQTQEKKMSNLIQHIVKTGTKTQHQRNLAQQDLMRIVHYQRQQEHFQLPTHRMTFQDN